MTAGRASKRRSARDGTRHLAACGGTGACAEVATRFGREALTSHRARRPGPAAEGGVPRPRDHRRPAARPARPAGRRSGARCRHGASRGRALARRAARAPDQGVAGAGLARPRAAGTGGDRQHRQRLPDRAGRRPGGRLGRARVCRRGGPVRAGRRQRRGARRRRRRAGAPRRGAPGRVRGTRSHSCALDAQACAGTWPGPARSRWPGSGDGPRPAASWRRWRSGTPATRRCWPSC